MGFPRLRAAGRKESRWWNVQFAFRQCSFNSLDEEQLEPIPQITCSLTQASRCSIDTVVRTLDPNALIIKCNRRGRQVDHTAPQWTVHHVGLSCPAKHIYIICIILSCVILPRGTKQKKQNKTLLLRWHGYELRTDRVQAMSRGHVLAACRFVLLMRLSFVRICSANAPLMWLNLVSTQR